MKNLAEIVDSEDIVTKDYVDLKTIISSSYDSATKTVTLTVGSLEDADNTEF